jgi:hypothetical protein
MPARSAVSAVHAVAASQSAALLSHTNTSATLRPPIIVERPPVTRPHPHIPPKRYGTRTIAREDRVEAVLPCSTLGGLYLQDEHGETNPVGCRDAFRLGEPSGKAFQELPGLRDPAFRIYRSLQQPGRFLLVPTTWRVGRYGPRAADRAYKPMMLLYAQLGDDPAADRYSLAATLVPDVGAAQLAGLRAALEPLTPAKAALDIVFPTDPFVAARVTFAWAVPESMPVPETLVVADSFTVTMAMNGPAALLVTAAIGGTGISGKADFALPDGTALNSELQLDGEVIGPAEGGPVIATRSADGVTLTNRTAQPANVFGLVCTDSTGTAREFAVGVKLDAGQARLLPDAIPDGACLVDARPAGITPIEALDLFVENISQSVLFVNQLNFANHGITALAVQARVKGAGPEQQVALAEGATLSMNFSLPVTAYLGGKSLEFALAVTKADGTQPLQWRERALAASAVIGITPDLL